jgi:hypothetical protein
VAKSKKKKTFEQSMQGKASKVFQGLQINIQAQAARTALTLREFIESQKAAGVSDSLLQQTLLEDLTSGGRIFGEFNRSLNLNVQGRLGQLSNEATKVELGVSDETEMIWIAALVDTCPDCLPRHGEVDTLKNWELRGEPRTGWSVCRLNCQCQLIEAADAKGRKELKEPLKRQRRN